MKIRDTIDETVKTTTLCCVRLKCSCFFSEPRLFRKMPPNAHSAEAKSAN